MKVVIKLPEGAPVDGVLDVVADSIRALYGDEPEVGPTRFTIDWGHAGTGWWKIEP